MAEYRFGRIVLEHVDRFGSAEAPSEPELRQIEAELAREADDPMRARGLARFLDATVFFSTEHLLELVMDRVRAGRIKVTREAEPVLDPGDSGTPATLARFADEDPDDESYVIAIEIVGEDDEPIPGARYKVTLPDGKELTGRSDGQGRALLWGLSAAGDCQIELPDLDEEAWEAIGSEPL